MRPPPQTFRPDRQRVAVVVNGLGAAGAARAAVEQAACLDPEHWQVEIASLELATFTRGELRLPQHVPVRRPGLSGLLRWLREFTPDLVHAHLAEATLACRLMVPFAGKPALVATCHELSDWREHRHQPLQLLARAALHHCGVVLAASEAVRAAIAAHDSALAARTRVLGSGTDLSAFAAVRGMRAAAREVLGYRAGTFIVGTVARLQAHQGLDVLLEAASQALHRVPGLELVVVGDGPERARLAALASEHGLSARVRFVGLHADVRPYLAAFDLFAAPSRAEGSGVTVIEALAAGVPVLGSPDGVFPELLDRGAAGWLVPLTPTAWADAIVHAARSPGELDRLSAAGRARAAAFSLDHMRARLVECYRAARRAGGEPGLEAAA